MHVLGRSTDVTMDKKGGRTADGDLLTWQLARKSAMSVLQVGQGFTTFCTLRVLPARAPLFTVSPCPYTTHKALQVNAFA